MSKSNHSPPIIPSRPPEDALTVKNLLYVMFDEPQHPGVLSHTPSDINFRESCLPGIGGFDMIARYFPSSQHHL